MPQRIQLRRGNLADLPVLALGEMGACLDTGAVFIGTASGNQQILQFGSASARYTVYGTRSLPQLITAVGGIAATASARQMHFVKGSGGPVSITANPQISAGTTVGDEMILVGTDDVNTLTINNGTGVDANGPIVLKAGSQAYLIWDGTNWSEVSRK